MRNWNYKNKYLFSEVWSALHHACNYVANSKNKGPVEGSIFWYTISDDTVTTWLSVFYGMFDLFSVNVKSVSSQKKYRVSSSFPKNLFLFLDT